jgi:hypothetical protein
VIAKNSETEDNIKHAIASVLYDILRIIESKNEDDDYIKKELLNVLLWKYSESSRKTSSNKIGIKKWSLNAVESLKRDNNEKNLIHDHAIPRKLLIKYLIDLNNPTVEFLRKILDTYCFGVVITKGEDKILNKKSLKQYLPNHDRFDENTEPMIRYKDPIDPINIVDVDWKLNGKIWELVFNNSTEA